MKGLASSLILLTLVAWGIAQPVEDTPLQVTHHDSLPLNDGYQEVFKIESTPHGLLKDDLHITVDGQPIAAQWTGGPHVAAGDTFQFPLVSYDTPRQLTIQGQGIQASITFGGGAGTPL